MVAYKVMDASSVQASVWFSQCISWCLDPSKKKKKKREKLVYLYLIFGVVFISELTHPSSQCHSGRAHPSFIHSKNI